MLEEKSPAVFTCFTSLTNSFVCWGMFKGEVRANEIRNDKDINLL